MEYECVLVTLGKMVGIYTVETKISYGRSEVK